MSHDLSLARRYAFNLARSLMVSVVLFEADGQYGVLPISDIDEANGLHIIHEYDPYEWVAR